MSIKNFFGRYKFLLITTFFLLLFLRILFFQVPLFRNLDLEISLVFSFIFSIFGAFSGLFLLKKKEKLIHILALNFILIVLLYLIFILLEVVVNQCPLTSGVFFFPVFTITTTSFGLFLSLFVYALEGIKSYVILTLIFLILIIYSLLEYYFEPQLFLYNPLIIFFPGLVYNEVFELDTRTLIYVLSILLSSLFVIFYHLLAEKHESRRLKKFELHLKIIPLLIFCFVFLFSETIGLNTSQSKLKKIFSFKLTDKNFDLYFERPVQNHFRKEIYRLSVEYYFYTLSKLTGLSPSKVEIFVFQDDRSKKKFLGDEVADFTKPWLKQIFVTEKSFQQTVKHELAHIFLGESTDNIFKVAGYFKLGLIEGGAMALEWEWFENTPLYYSALIDRFIGKFSEQDFFKNYSFVMRQSYLSYIMSGSFCRYLIDKYGIEKFLIFYNTGKFNPAYDSSIENEFQFFLNSIRNIKLNSADSLKALALFGGKSILEKSCSRSLGRLKYKADNLFLNRKFNEAEKIYSKIYSIRKDPESFLNILRTKFFQKKYDEVINLYKNSETRNKINGLSSIRTLIFYALSLAKRNEIDESTKIFDQLKTLNLSSNWNAYFETLSLLLNKPELIDLLTENSFVEFINKIKDEFPDNPVILKNIIDSIDSRSLDVVVKNSIDDFWILSKCFFRYIELGNFVKAAEVLDLINSNKLVSNETEKYQFDLMNYINKHITKGEVNLK